jgi:DNA-binding HxlR family transcriptional regulator
LKRLRRAYTCPVELSLDFVGGKWRTVIFAWFEEAAPRASSRMRSRLRLESRLQPSRL